MGTNGPAEWTRDGFLITTDKARMNVAMIHDFLTNAYWAAGRTRDVVQQSIDNSLVFGLFEGDHQIGFARVVTDLATAAFLSDLFILDAYRGRGLGRWMVETILSHPECGKVPSWLLKTRDAHDLYGSFGFTPLPSPERFMIRVRDIEKPYDT
jgi:GNAT superfamily N-acetyltransferase